MVSPVTPPSVLPSPPHTHTHTHIYLSRAGAPVHTLGTPTHPVVAVEQVHVNVRVAVHARVSHFDGVLAVIQLQVLGGVDEPEVCGVRPGKGRQEGEGGDEETHDGLFLWGEGREERVSVCVYKR